MSQGQDSEKDAWKRARSNCFLFIHYNFQFSRMCIVFQMHFYMTQAIYLPDEFGIVELIPGCLHVATAIDRPPEMRPNELIHYRPKSVG